MFFSRDTEKEVSIHPLIGQQFTAGAKAYYMEGCTNPEACATTKSVREIDRALSCEPNNRSVEAIYSNTYPIPQDKVFTLRQLLKVRSHGLNIIGGEGYVLAVLQDNDGLLSTELFSSLSDTDRPYGFRDGKICNY